MAVVQNIDFDPSTLVTIDDSILNSIPKRYGRIAESGLFTEEGIVTDTYGFRYNDEDVSVMTGTKSRLGREADRVNTGKQKRAYLSGITFKQEGAIMYEDIANRVRDWASLTVEARNYTVADLMAEKLPPIRQSMEQMEEYSLLSTLQGRTLDPYDNSVEIDMFANLGKTRTTLTFDLTATADVLGQITALVNQLMTAQTYGSGFTGVEVMIGEAAFSALVAHPQIVAMYEAAYTGTGSEYINNPFINGRVNELNRSVFGFVRSVTIHGVTFSTYPQKFTKWDRTAITPIADNKGFTVLRGVDGLYQAKYVPAPYLDYIGTQGQKLYAWQTPVKDRTHFEFYLEKHAIYFMSQPELSLDITFTLPTP